VLVGPVSVRAPWGVRRSNGLVYHPGSPNADATVERVTGRPRRFSLSLVEGRQCLLPLSQEDSVVEDATSFLNADVPRARPQSFSDGCLSGEPSSETMSEVFNCFLSADCVATTLRAFRELMTRCGESGPEVELPYRRLLRLEGFPWRARSVWSLLEARARRPEYADAPLKHRHVVVVGAGPCGMRAALELALLGSEVLVVEKRSAALAFGRINRLHLWEWCKQDLLAWGAKVFDPPGGTFGGDNDFCHIGIGDLQLLLLKSALLLGVRLRFGWEAKSVEQQVLLSRCGLRVPCDALLLASGASSPLCHQLGLKSVGVELRGKGSAIGVVANFVNARDSSQMALRQFSWARQFNQPLFAKLRKATGADLENIVYYKGPSHHYIVFTPTKRCLFEKGVILDSNVSSGLLHESNVDVVTLSLMVQEIATFFGLPTDLAEEQGVMIFDFSGVRRLESAATMASGVFACAVGDALLEPFWPEGLGIIRGFMSAMDAASAVVTALTGDAEEALAQTSQTYNVLKSVAAQTASHCLQKDIRRFGLSPQSRYISVRCGKDASTRGG